MFLLEQNLDEYDHRIHRVPTGRAFMPCRLWAQTPDDARVAAV